MGRLAVQDPLSEEDTVFFARITVSPGVNHAFFMLPSFSHSKPYRTAAKPILVTEGRVAARIVSEAVMQGHDNAPGFCPTVHPWGHLG
jgi:hypothetical protein